MKTFTEREFSDATEAVEFRRWFHVLPVGEITYEGKKIDFTEALLQELHDKYQLMRGVGAKLPILVGQHSGEPIVQTTEAVGFVVDSKVVLEHDEVSRGLWLLLEIRNSQIIEKLAERTIDGISAGIYSVEDKELAKTGELINGLVLDHVTLTNLPRLTWLDAPRIALQIFKKPNTITEIQTRDCIPQTKGVGMADMELQAKLGKLEATVNELQFQNSELQTRLADYEKAEAEMKAKLKAENDSKIELAVDGLIDKGVFLAGKEAEVKEAYKAMDFDGAMKLLQSLNTDIVVNLSSVSVVKNEAECKEAELIEEQKATLNKFLKRGE